MHDFSSNFQHNINTITHTVAVSPDCSVLYSDSTEQHAPDFEHGCAVWTEWAYDI